MVSVVSRRARVNATAGNAIATMCVVLHQSVALLTSAITSLKNYTSSRAGGASETGARF